jgi:hypothetical protein
MLRTRALALPLLLVLTLAGCGSSPLPRALGGPAEALPFASAEDALAAAVEVYLGFQEAYAELASRPGDDPTRLSEWATGEYLEVSLSDLEFMALNGWRSTGEGTSSAFVLRTYSPSSSKGIVVMDLCDNITDVDIVDQEGGSIVQGDRNNIGTMSATFDLVDGQILLADRELVKEGC